MFPGMDEEESGRVGRFRSRMNEDEIEIRDWLLGRGSTVVTVVFIVLMIGTLYFMVAL